MAQGGGNRGHAGRSLGTAASSSSGSGSGGLVSVGEAVGGESRSTHGSPGNLWKAPVYANLSEPL